MGKTEGRDQEHEAPEDRQPRFGSYIGLCFILAMLGILAFELIHDPGVTHAYNALRPGMTATEVAALLGSPRSETKDGARVVQTWRIPDGHTIVVAFRDGKLTSKERKPTSDR